MDCCDVVVISGHSTPFKSLEPLHGAMRHIAETGGGRPQENLWKHILGMVMRNGRNENKAQNLRSTI